VESAVECLTLSFKINTFSIYALPVLAIVGAYNAVIHVQHEKEHAAHGHEDDGKPLYSYQKIRKKPFPWR
jgi:hypothetical protein